MKNIKLILFLILIGGFVLRLYKLDSPVADWHSWRQSDTSAVSRNFVRQGFDILHPRFDDLSNVPSGLDNPNGYRFVEFPIYNLAQAGMFGLIGIFNLEEWGRLINAFSSLLSALFLYFIVKKHKSELAAILTVLAFSLLPFNIYFGRVILPDPMMVMAILGGTYFFDLWIEKSSKFKVQSSKLQLIIRNYLFFILAVVFTSAAFLLKPYALFFTLPMLYLAFKNFGLKTLINWKLWIFAIVSVVPLIWWRTWIQQYPEGIPASDWLFNGGNIRFRPAYFRWIFGERIGKLILGLGGIPILLLGIYSLFIKYNNIRSVKYIFVNLISIFKDSGFFLSFLLSTLLYLFVIARGNVQHDYYQILIIPTLSIFLGLGAEFLLRDIKKRFPILNSKLSILFIVVCFVVMIGFGWQNIKNNYNLNYPFIRAGAKIDTLIPVNAKVIAINDGDTSFLYQTKRKGWASFEKDLPEMIKMGADYLILPNPKQTDYNIGKEYKIVSSSSDYILFDLRQKP